MLPTKPTQMRVTALSGWGRYPRADQTVERPEKSSQLGINEGSTLARGQGRSYGDAALNSQGTVVLTERLDRFLEFDESTGVLKAESGATLAEILEHMVPKGWFLPVTPGTKFCSLGGCVAADVHGKNHHREGSFCEHVTGIELVLADGSKIACSATEVPELFWATVGGMGLTGIIETVSLKLVPIETAYIKVKHRKAGNLEVAFNLMDNDVLDDSFSVCWIDLLSRGRKLGRSILMTGHHAAKSEVPLRSHEPLKVKKRKTKVFKREWPRIALSAPMIRLFNSVFYWRQCRRKEFLTDYDEFFYPLDRIHNWNLMYGKRGFVQYQFVLPTVGGREGVKKIVTMLAKSRCASFLAVLKRMGPEGKGMLSFPMEGYTLALDIPLSNSVVDLLKKLDEIVLQHKGRVYLAKDSRLPAETFRKMYPRLDEFIALKRQADPEVRFTSDLARRLEIVS